MYIQRERERERIGARGWGQSVQSSRSTSVCLYYLSLHRGSWLGTECAIKQIDVWSLQDLKEFLDEVCSKDKQ
jgi:hypothetical protein